MRVISHRRTYISRKRAYGLRLHERRNGNDAVGEKNGKNSYGCYGQDRRPRYPSPDLRGLAKKRTLQIASLQNPSLRILVLRRESPILSPCVPSTPGKSSRRGPFATKIVGSSRFSSDTAVMQVGIS